MVAATAKISGMADKKKKTAKTDREPNRSPAWSLFVRLPVELEEAVAAYIDSRKPKPSLTATITTLLETALAQDGFWPPKKKEGE